MKKLSHEKWCSTFIQNLRNHLNLQTWRIIVKFSDRTKEDTENCYAEICCDSVYMHATLTIYPVAKEDFDGGDLDHLSFVLTHELCHILIDPLDKHVSPHLSSATRGFYFDDMENVTQRIALVVHKSLPKNLIPPR